MVEYVKGNRLRRSGRPRSMPTTRWVGNVALSFLTKIASGYWHVFDPQRGFVAITSPALRRLNLDGIARDYFFENDMLIRRNVIDARVVDIDMAALYGDETPYVRVSRVAWTFPRRLLKRSAWRFLKRHIINDFGLIALLTFVGGVLALFGAAFGISHWVRSAGSGIPATAGAAMIAVVSLILGAQMLLQALSLEVQGSPGAAETRTMARDAVKPSAGDGPQSPAAPGPAADPVTLTTRD
jgi:dolichol-phosphate mannosyltransferase